MRASATARGNGAGLATALAAVLITAPAATAQTWTGATNFDWFNNGNWAPAFAPNTNTSTATFAGAAPGTINLGAGPTVEHLQFTSGANYTIGSGAMGSQVLTLDSGFFQPSITQSGVGTTIINARINTIAFGGGPAVNVSAGRLEFRNTTSGTANVFGGPTYNVSGGTLVGYADAAGSVSTGSGANIFLSGGTYEIRGELTAGGLRAQYYNIAHRDNATTGGLGGSSSADFAGLTNAATSLDHLARFTAGHASYTPSVTTIGADQTAPAVGATYNGGGGANAAYSGFYYDNGSGGNGALFTNDGFTPVDNIRASFTGRINITTTGDYTFSTRSDDGSLVFVDGVLVTNNNLFQGMTTRTGTINLTAGTHDIMVTFYEGGGGAGLNVTYRGPDVAGATVAPTGFAVGDAYIPSNVLSAGQGRVNLGQNVNLSADSAVNVIDAYEAVMGTLSFDASSVLSVNNGYSGIGNLRFASTNFNSGNTVGFNTDVGGDIALGQVSNFTGGPVTVNKIGGGSVILDSSAVPNNLSSVTWNLQAGRLVAARQSDVTVGSVDPLGGSVVNLNGGHLLLNNLTGSGTASFLSEVNILQNATIEAHGNGNGVAEVLLGTNGTPLDIASGAVATFRVNTAMVMRLATNIMSAGGTANVEKIGRGELVFTQANTFDGQLNIVDGTVIVEANGALGSTVGATILTNNGNRTALAFRGGVNYTAAEAVTINGDGSGASPAHLGSLDSMSGNNSFAGNITLGSTSRIGVRRGTLTLNGNLLTGNNALNLELRHEANQGHLVVNGSVGVGGNTSVITLVQNNNNGAFSDGTATFNGAINTGGIINVNGGTMVINNTLAAGSNAANNRINTNSGTTRITHIGGLGGRNLFIDAPTATGLDAMVQTGSRSGMVEFAVGTGNTLTSAGTTTVSVDGGRVTARSGIIELSNAAVTFTTKQVDIGLRHGFLAGNPDTVTANPGNGGTVGGSGSVTQFVNGVTAGQTNVGGGIPWADNRTWVYTGQVYDVDGVFSFAENIDDVSHIYINGVQVLSNGAWNVPTTTGASSADNAFGGVTNFGVAKSSDGWYDIEIRMSNGGGGAGAVAGSNWTATKGFGFSSTGSTSTDGNNYVIPTDPGDGSLFRHVSGGGYLTVDENADLRIASLTGGADIHLGGGGNGLEAVLRLVDAGGPVADTAAAVKVVADFAPLGGNGTPTAQLFTGTNHTLTAPLLDIVGGGFLRKTGAGTLTFTTTQNIGALGTFRVEAGTAFFNGTGTGTGVVQAATGGILGGTGSVGGLVNIQTGGILAPGTTGVGTLTGNDGLDFDAGGIFRWDLTDNLTTGPGTNWDQFVLTAGDLTIDAAALFQPVFSGATTGPTATAFWSAAQTWTDVISLTGTGQTVTGGAFAIDNSAWAALGSFSTQFNGTTGIDLVWTPIPEPTTWTLLAVGAGAGLLVARRRRSAKSAS